MIGGTIYVYIYQFHIIIITIRKILLKLLKIFINLVYIFYLLAHKLIICSYNKISKLIHKYNFNPSIISINYDTLPFPT